MLVVGTRRGSDSVGSGGSSPTSGASSSLIGCLDTAPNTLVLVPRKGRAKSDMESGTVFGSDA